MQGAQGAARRWELPEPGAALGADSSWGGGAEEGGDTVVGIIPGGPRSPLLWAPQSSGAGIPAQL